jgi:hypothetical protein
VLCHFITYQIKKVPTKNKSVNLVDASQSLLRSVYFVFLAKNKSWMYKCNPEPDFRTQDQCAVL